jgi:hypothetical protein
MAPALRRLTFAALTSWVVLFVCGSGFAVGVAPQATCRAWIIAPVVLSLPGRPRYVLSRIIY